jgi:hypothetical protein
MVERASRRATERAARRRADLVNPGRAGRPPIARQPPGSAISRAIAECAEAEPKKHPPEPVSRHGVTRRKEALDVLEPETSVARPLVELDPRHAVIE